MTKRRGFAASALLLTGALALAGCATANPGSAPSEPAPGPAVDLEVDAVWLDGGRMIALVTQGSSTCVPTATDVTAQGGVLSVTLADPEAEACTRDLVPRATGVALPEGLDGASELTIDVTYGDARGDTDLDAYDGAAVAEYTPSAAWIDDGLFAILTWGSSTCAPAVETVTAEGTAITATFATPPADQVCTMDMGPRIALASVPDAVDDAATVTLAGGGAEFATPVTIPIHD